MKCVSLPHPTFYFDVAEAPRVTTHPRDLKDVVPDKPVMFTTEATGIEPLNYQWEWKPTMYYGKWQPWHVMLRGSQVQMVPHQPSPVFRSPMKGATAVSSATVMVARHPIQLNLVLVRIQFNTKLEYDVWLHVLHLLLAFVM